MRISARRTSLNTWALSLACASILLELLFGYRVSQEAGWVTEIFSMLMFSTASILIFAPRGQKIPLVVAALSLAFMVMYGFVNATFTTYLDIKYGGDYAWSSTRTMVLSIVVYPTVAFITAVAVFVISKLRLVTFSE